MDPMTEAILGEDNRTILDLQGRLRALAQFAETERAKNATIAAEFEKLKVELAALQAQIERLKPVAVQIAG